MPASSTRWAATSDMGRVRTNNEDSAYAGRRLYAVADGLGGHVAGEVASATVIQCLRAWDTEACAMDPLTSLSTAIRTANETLASKIDQDPGLLGMGTTLTAILLADGHAAIANIGDSRAYLLRDGWLIPLSEDHSMGQLVGEAATSPALADVIVRYLDGRLDRSPDLALRKTQAGDRLLLCSDGLSGVVPEESICRVLTSTPDTSAAVHQLVNLANVAGGPDNITVVLIDVGTTTADLEPMTVGAAA